MIGWNSRTSKKKSSNTATAKTSHYHSVEVKASKFACVAVMEIEGKRFLSADAPPLPLPECDQNCNCRYEHYDDRRQGDRRDSDVSNLSSINEKGEKKNRRLGGDRRRNSANKSVLK